MQCGCKSWSDRPFGLVKWPQTTCQKSFQMDTSGKGAEDVLGLVQKDWHKKAPPFCVLCSGEIPDCSSGHLEEWSGSTPSHGSGWLLYGQLLPVSEWSGGRVCLCAWLLLLGVGLFGALPDQSIMVYLTMTLEWLCSLVMYLKGFCYLVVQKYDAVAPWPDLDVQANTISSNLES